MGCGGLGSATWAWWFSDHVGFVNVGFDCFTDATWSHLALSCRFSGLCALLLQCGLWAYWGGGFTCSGCVANGLINSAIYLLSIYVPQSVWEKRWLGSWGGLMEVCEAGVGGCYFCCSVLVFFIYIFFILMLYLKDAPHATLSIKVVHYYYFY